MHKARPVTLSPTGDARPEVAEPSPTREPTIFPSRPRTSYGAPHLQGRGITSPPKNVSPAVTRYRDLGDGRRHMATGMHGSEPAEDIVVDALRSTRYHVSPSRGDCRDACAIRSVHVGKGNVAEVSFIRSGQRDRWAITFVRTK